MTDSDEVKPCECPERLVDMACYGIHACKDGKRIAPEDLYVEPSDEVKLLPCNLDDATAEQIERANEAVSYQMNDDGTPKWQSAQGYACALTAIMLTDTRPPVVTDEVVALDRLIAASTTIAGLLDMLTPGTEIHEAIEQARAVLASMPAVVSGGQSLGDDALPPSGSSQSSLSRSETAAAIARKKP